MLTPPKSPNCPKSILQSRLGWMLEGETDGEEEGYDDNDIYIKCGTKLLFFLTLPSHK